jgi:hypothetical protein
VSTQLLAAFRGVAYCRRGSGAVQWCVSGEDRDSGVRLELLLSGATALQLPAQIAAPELHASDGAGWELRSRSQVWPLAVRAVQVHRDAAAAFASALPRVAAPWRARAGWIVLLNLLRVPGLARLLGRLRGR